MIFHHMTKEEIYNLCNYDNSDDFIVMTKQHFIVLVVCYFMVILMALIFLFN